MVRHEEGNRSNEVKKHLGPSLNRVIYHRLTKGDRAGLFEPSVFFNLLDDIYLYATAGSRSPSMQVERFNKIALNKKQPLGQKHRFTDRLNKVDITDEQKSFLLHYLDTLFLEESILTDLERQLDSPFTPRDTSTTSYQIDVFFEWAKLQPPIERLAGYRDALTSVVGNYFHNGNPTPGGDELVRSNIAAGVEQRFQMALRDRYNLKRVKLQVRNLPDDETRAVFLLERKTEYLQLGAPLDLQLGAPAYPSQGTPRAYWSKAFDQKCDLEIDKLKMLMALEPTNNASNKAQDETNLSDHQKGYTLHRKALTLLLLTFGRLDVPEDVQKDKVVEFFHFLTGHSKQNIRAFLTNPTKVKDSKKSVKYLCANLHFIRDQFLRLGISENVQRAMSEIEFLLEAQEDKEISKTDQK